MERWEDAEWAGWLEQTMRGIVDVDPVSIALEMIDADGDVYTCYWMTDENDRAKMIRGMQDDDKMEWLKKNREEILEILNEDDEEEDGEGGEDG